LKRYLVGTAFLIVLTTQSARSDFFGGDIPLLAQILSNSIQQLGQLRSILSANKDNLELLQSINQGINDSLNLYRTVFPNSDPGIFKEWEKTQGGLLKLQTLYGMITPSPESAIEADTDEGVIEAISLNNSIYDYSMQIDEIGEQIKTYSHSVSPGGAQKLTAQTLGVMLHVMNQSLRAQATGLKIQAQTLAIQNHKDKEMTRHSVDASNSLQAAMKNEKDSFEIPRF